MITRTASVTLVGVTLIGLALSGFAHPVTALAHGGHHYQSAPSPARLCAMKRELRIPQGPACAPMRLLEREGRVATIDRGGWHLTFAPNRQGSAGAAYHVEHPRLLDRVDAGQVVRYVVDDNSGTLVRVRPAPSPGQREATPAPTLRAGVTPPSQAAPNRGAGAHRLG